MTSRRRPRSHVAPLLVAALACTVLGITAGPAEPAGALPCSPAQDTCGGDPGYPGDPGDGGGGGGGGGGGTSTLTQPSVYIAGRTDTQLTVGWFVSDVATSYRLEYTVNGAWATLQNYSAGGEASYTHGSLGRDTRHCYRVVARAGTQTKTSATACAWTKDGLILRNLWRVQVRITTGDVPDGDTDDDVQVGVFGPINGRTGGRTWLDHDEDDFERGVTHSYDLIDLEGVNELGDIEGLEIYKPGTDAWCLRNVAVVVNDAVVFAQGFGDPCQWVNGGATELVKIEHDTLHDYPLWGKRTATSGPIAGYRIPYETILDGNDATLIIGHEQLEGRIESEVGDAMVGTDAYWAPPDAVELTRWDAQRAKVDLDLKGEAPGTNPDIDVDFDMVVGTHKDATGKWFVDIETQHAQASIDPTWYQWLFNAMSAGAEISGPERRIEMAIEQVALQVGIAQVYRLTASFDDGGNLVIHATLQCPMGDGPAIPRECLDGNQLPLIEG